MKNRSRKTLTAIAAVAGLALGGAGLAAATGNLDGQESGAALSSSERSSISRAALEATGGGKVNEMERDGENGATYEAEVTRPDGSTVDVRLDERYELVVIEGDREDADESADGDDG